MNMPKETPKSPAIHCAYDKLVNVGKLTPNPRNPNRHPENQIKLLAKIIQEQGWRAPIIVSRRSNMIVAGHGRYAAAKLIGLKQAPVNYQDFESEAAETAHMLADNKLAELSEMDGTELAGLLKEMGSTAFDLTGFSTKDLEDLLKLTAEPQAPTEFPEVDENIPTEHQCPKCSYRWSGKSHGQAK
jgi:ParB-like chromosome segregation protein Spo0J